MAVRYTSVFRLWSVFEGTGDRTKTARRQFRKERTARAEAAKTAKALRCDPEEILQGSSTFYAVEIQPGQKAKRVNTGSATLEGARAWCRERERAGTPSRSRRSAMTLGDAIDLWLGECSIRIREKSLLDYSIHARKWKELIGGSKPVASITHEDLVSFLKKRGTIKRVRILKTGEKVTVEKKASARLLNVNRTLLKALFKWAAERGHVDRDPTLGIKPWKEPRREPRALTLAETQALLRAAKEPYTVTGIIDKHGAWGNREGRDRTLRGAWAAEYLPDPELYPAIVLGLTTMLRSANITGLGWGDLDLKERVLRIPAERMKTNTEHVVPLSPATVAMLAGLEKGGPDDPVLAVGSFRRGFVSALKRAGLRHATPHCLRRTGATYLAQRGVPTEVIKRLGGWSVGGDVLFSHYRRIEWKELVDAVKVLDELVTGVSAATAKAKESGGA